VRATGSYLGHGLEPQFPMNVALATLAIQHGRLFPPCDPSGLEKPLSGAVDRVLVTSVGHWRGEGLAVIERVG
jgi:3-oxoacyl-[acyl-carrier-protein] synthase II